MGLQPIILLASFVALYVVIRHSVEKAFLDVYLPILLCFPLYDTLKWPGLPFLTFADTAIFPIGVWLFATRWRSWKLTRSDFWILLFALSTVWTMFQTEPTNTPGICYLFTTITGVVFPYAIGKLIIEQGQLRIQLMKRFAFLLAVIGFVSLYEYRMGSNPFHKFWGMLIPDDFAAFEQMRWGFTRVSGPYFQSETTGMVFLVAVLFAYWLYRNGDWERKFRYIKHPYTKRTLILVGVGIGMFINQARGPYLGFIVAIIIMRAAVGRNLRRGIWKTALVLFLLVAIGYPLKKMYTSATLGRVDSDRGSAVYRDLLIQNYTPIVKEGGWFGWGLHPPLVTGQESIDNAYLFFGLTQGYVGAGTFAILVIEAMICAFGSLRRLRQKRDVEFIFCMAGAVAGIAFCLGTVYLTAPVTEILFLLMGWSQSLSSSTAVAGVVETQQRAVPGYKFRRVFT